jgi:hypothetical protein
MIRTNGAHRFMVAERSQIAGHEKPTFTRSPSCFSAHRWPDWVAAIVTSPISRVGEGPAGKFDYDGKCFVEDAQRRTVDIVCPVAGIL